MNKIKKYTIDYFKAVGHSLFFDNAYFGIALLFLFAYFDHKLFLFAFATSIIGYGYSIFNSTPKILKDCGLITINCFFFGIAMASMFQITPSFFLFLILGTLGIPLLTKAVFEVLQHWKLSPNFIPYIFMTWIFYLAARGGAFGLQTEVLSESAVVIPDFFAKFFPLQVIWISFEGVSRIFFSSHAFLGLALIILVTLFSPRRGFFFFMGTILATAISFFLSAGGTSWEHGMFSYCAGLVGLGLASFPEKIRWSSIFFFCIISSLLTMAIEQLLKVQALPILSLPYVLTYWIALLSRVPRINVSWAPGSKPKVSTFVRKTEQVFYDPR